MGRFINRLKIAFHVLFVKNYAYFQYDRAEFIECANMSAFRNKMFIVSPNEEDDVNNFFLQVLKYYVDKELMKKTKED